MKNSFVKILVLVTVIFMDILTGMEFDLFVPSFPQLQSHFNLSPFWVEWAKCAIRRSFAFSIEASATQCRLISSYHSSAREGMCCLQSTKNLISNSLFICWGI